MCTSSQCATKEENVALCRTRNKSPNRGKTTGLVKPNRFLCNKMDVLTTYVIKFCIVCFMPVCLFLVGYKFTFSWTPELLWMGKHPSLSPAEDVYMVKTEFCIFSSRIWTLPLQACQPTVFRSLENVCYVTKPSFWKDFFRWREKESKQYSQVCIFTKLLSYLERCICVGITDGCSSRILMPKILILISN